MDRNEIVQLIIKEKIKYGNKGDRMLIHMYILRRQQQSRYYGGWKWLRYSDVIKSNGEETTPLIPKRNNPNERVVTPHIVLIKINK